jgi:hypothetical protein
MSTNAVYFFKEMFRNDRGTTNICAVYKHSDNYSEDAASYIEAAKEFAWKLPRFEADEFASAFVAANKNKDGGEIRLIPLFEHTTSPEVMKNYPSCEHYYDITYDAYRLNDLTVHTHEKRYEKKINEYVWEITSYMPHQQMLRAFAEENSNEKI